MQNFLQNDRLEPSKKPVLARIKNFSEIYETFEFTQAKPQADRCVQCGIPYCSYGCPLSNYIPQWLKAVAQNNLKLAFKLSNQSSPFPEIMGRVCPQDKLCEGTCTLNDAFGAITIGSIETFITEEGFKQGLSVSYPETLSNKKVAVIGSGPAGLSVATFLLRAGIGVDMYEKESFAGGLLSWGIPDFKLNKQTVFNRVNWLKKAGLNLKLGCEVGKDISFEQVMQSSDAVFLAFGAKKANSGGINGETLGNVYQAMDFLGMSQCANLPLAQFNRLDIKGKSVMIIGGGDTAMDCARTAIREGAAKTVCVYRRNEATMPGSKKEYKNAIEEGVEFLFNLSPKEIKADGCEFIGTELVKSDANPRGILQEIPNSMRFIGADIIVLALGFEAEVPEFIKHANITLDKWGQVIVNSDRQTSVAKIFAGGDCVRGANLVVNAALDGREAAKSILKFIEAN